MMGFKLKIATPEGYEPKPEFLAEFADCVEVFNKAEDAAVNADLIVTDVWASMGQEEEQKLREKHTQIAYLCIAYLHIAARKFLKIC